ncbi:hypothetical protein [Burkholderia catarinensis]|uniref:hypothetical protein n=1 Tax=Burkholderia catarinensis TaxID=1108140 RepID=UPI0009193DC8|nr:hypothetical protein [Burkholderia catarinensis]KAG8152305.1 hypothetical protein BFF94_016310 [Burkholderia catarinensis]
MGQLVELAIAASSGDEFDKLCDRAEALAGVIAMKVNNKANKIETLQARLVTSYRRDLATLTVTLELDADAIRSFELSLDGRTTLDAIERLTLH